MKNKYSNIIKKTRKWEYIFLFSIILCGFFFYNLSILTNPQAVVEYGSFLKMSIRILLAIATLSIMIIYLYWLEVIEN